MMQCLNSSVPKSPNKFVSAAPKRRPEQLRKGVTIARKMTFTTVPKRRPSSSEMDAPNSSKKTVSQLENARSQ